MTKLSEDLLAEFENGVEPSVGYDSEIVEIWLHRIARARAIEERVAELEAASRAKGVGIKAFSNQLAAATARAPRGYYVAVTNDILAEAAKGEGE